MTDLSTRNDFCVYIHTSPSGKSYVGQTCGNPKRRWCGGHGYKSNRYFWSAIQKYGWKSFEHVILASDLTQEQANFYEKMYIRFLGSDDRRFGYNIQEGGRSAGGISEEGRARMVAAHSGAKAPNARPVVAFDLNGKRIGSFTCATYAAVAFGIKRSTILTHLSKHSGTCAGYIFRYKSEVGDATVLPPDEIYKPHEQRKIRGANSRFAKAVCVYDLDGTFLHEFGSATEAAAFLGVTTGTVCESAHRGKGTCGNKLVRFATSELGQSDLPLLQSVVRFESQSRRKAVCQYDLNGAFIKSYDSISAASTDTGIAIETISRCVHLKDHQSGGYQWRFDDGVHSDIGRAKTKTEVRKEHRAYPYKPVWRLDPVTHERLERYESIRAAGRAIGVDKANIQAVIKGKKKTCRGYGWEYDV